MGRSSKSENTSNDTAEFQEQSATTAFPYQNEPQTAANRAVSESESMARDIKEGRLSGFVGAGTVLTGETNFTAMLRVDGHLTGSVSSEEGTLIIGSTGQVDANINVASAMISGTVNGDINATEKLQLGRTAKVVGNIQSPRLILEDGAILEGNCSMLKAKERQEQEVLEQQKQYSTGNLYEETAEETDTEALLETEEEEETTDSYYSTSETDADDDDDDEENAEAATI